ncbi:MAG: hypothetical protein WBL11_02370 [Bacteroidales bacterium]|jgi:hypothetical protein|nr:hypothetical protein [Bacteroidales bacterium]MDD2593247.1 hypothetical protein [Bacteroidales bacterium]MDD3755295.1 hypothetical protein [Bacteroidales bacterium]MDY0400905.1 hypothetical protein [Bacteroidales bacterium]HHW58858.1 hypothetical protein [Bacteroidales bacterium]
MKKFYFFIILNIFMWNSIYSQNYLTKIKRNLIEYQVSDSLKKMLIDYIINDFSKYSDSLIYFLIDANGYKYLGSSSTNTDTCVIHIGFITEILPSIEKEIKGFFKLNNKLFFVINGHKDFLYPTDSIKEVEYMRVKSHKDNPLLEFLFYEDDMPFWLFDCKDGEFYLIDYWKNYNFPEWK